MNLAGTLFPRPFGGTEAGSTSSKTPNIKGKTMAGKTVDIQDLTKALQSVLGSALAAQGVARESVNLQAPESIDSGSAPASITGSILGGKATPEGWWVFVGREPEARGSHSGKSLVVGGGNALFPGGIRVQAFAFKRVSVNPTT